MMDDLIKRQDAVNELSYCQTYLFDSRDHDKKISLEDAEYTIERLPSAQQWIPCSERLPTKAGHYLCSFKKPNRIDRIHVDLAYWTGGRWIGYIGDEINAWMSLPEPYKEEKNDN